MPKHCETTNLSDAAKGFSRVEGLMIVPDDQIDAIATFLEKRAVIAVLEWYPASRSLLSLTLSADDQERVGLYNGQDQGLKPGVPLEDLAQDLAHTFSAEVMLGSARVNEYFDAHPGEHTTQALQSTAAVQRCAIITDLPQSTVPLLASSSRTTLYGADQSARSRLILFDVLSNPAPRLLDTYEAMSVEIDYSPGEQVVRFYPGTGENLAQDGALGDYEAGEALWTFSFARERRFIYGYKEPSVKQRDFVHALVGRVGMGEAIAKVLPGTKADKICAALEGRGDFAAFMDGLNLDPEVQEFLLGTRSPGDISGISVYEPGSLFNAIARSVDLRRNESATRASQLWSGYRWVAVERPWIIVSVVALEMAAGLGLLAYAGTRTRPGSRRWPLILLGLALVIDSVAELALASFVSRNQRQQRSR